MPTVGVGLLLALAIFYFALATDATIRHELGRGVLGYLGMAEDGIPRDDRGLRFFGASLTFGVVLVLVLFCSPRLGPRAVWILVPVAAAIYLTWCFLAQPNHIDVRGDFRVYFNQSASLADSGFRDLAINLRSKSPATLWYYAVFIFVFGKSWSSIYLGSTLVWCLQPLLLYKVLDRIEGFRKAAPVAAFLYALMPSVIGFTGLPSSESLFITLTLLSVWLCLRASDQPRLGHSTLIGCVLALAFLTRFTGLVYGVSFLLFLLFVWLRARRSLLEIGKNGLVIAVSAVAVLTPLTIYNGLHGPGFIPASYHGQRVVTVKGLVHFNGFDKVSPEFRRAAAKYEAIKERVLADRGPDGAPDLASYSRALVGVEASLMARVMERPIRYLRWAVTTKVDVLWARDTSLLWRSLVGSPHEEAIGRYRWLINPIMQGFYLFVMTSALLGLLVMLGQCLRGTLGDPLSVGFLLLAPALLMAASHVIVEVRPRFHAPFMPFLVALGAYASMWMLDLFSRRPPAHAAEGTPEPAQTEPRTVRT